MAILFDIGIWIITLWLGIWCMSSHVTPVCNNALHEDDDTSEDDTDDEVDEQPSTAFEYLFQNSIVRKHLLRFLQHQYRYVYVYNTSCRMFDRVCSYQQYEKLITDIITSGDMDDVAMFVFQNNRFIFTPRNSETESAFQLLDDDNVELRRIVVDDDNCRVETATWVLCQHLSPEAVFTTHVI